MKRIALVLGLVGCVGPNNLIAYTPASGHTSAPKATTVQRAVVAFTDAGLEIDSSDAATGIALSKWKEPGGFSSLRVRIRVVVSDSGDYKVEALCQQKQTLDTTAWEDCDTDKRPRYAVELVARVDKNIAR